ncbi:hypothetical protein, partial [Candidatus Ichthyocystis sparus]|uniref:hypothetical protein n=1 Tax=Candidatus Ichthyocystis sparus TaxID=1561004 RepID=UPI00159ECE1C
PEKESLLASIFCFMDKESIGNFSDSYFVSNLCHHQVYSELPADCDELSRDIVPVNLFYSKSKEDLYRHLGYLSANDLVSFNDFITNTSGCNNKSGINKDDSVDAMFNSGYEIFCCDNYKQFGNCKELESLIQLKVFLDDVISERNSYFSSNFPSRIDPSSIGDTDWSECTQSRVWSDYFESKWLPIPKWNAHSMYQVVHGDGSNDLIGSYNRGKHFVFSLPEPCYLGKGNVVVRQPVMPEFNFDSDYRLSFLNSTREFYNCDPLCFLNEDYILHRGDVCCPHTYNYGGMCKNLLLKMVGETLCSAAKIIVLLNKSEFLLEASSKGGYLRKSFYHLAKVY